MKNIILFIFSVWLLSLVKINAQEAISAGGGSVAGAGGGISYTIGQVAYTAISGTNGSLSQGIQFPYEISVITELPEGKSFNLSFATYPNPTSDFLILSIDGVLDGNFIYRLFDADGRFIEEKSILDNKTKIEMQYLSTGIYILKVSASDAEGLFVIKTFKIIKN